MGVTAVAEAAFQDYGDATHGHTQQLRTSTVRSLGTGSPPCTVRRVGGGYAVAMVDEALSPTLPHDTLLSTLGTQQQLSPEDAAHPVYSDADLSLVREILLLTEARVLDQYQRGAGSSEVTLAKLLKAYDKVLPLHGMQPQEDVFYFRILLRLSLDPEPNWWTKFEALVRTNARRQALSTCTSPTATARFTGTGALHTLSKAATSVDMHHALLASQQQQPTPWDEPSSAGAGAGSSSRHADGTSRQVKQRTSGAAASGGSSSTQRVQQRSVAAGGGGTGMGVLSGGSARLSRRASAPGSEARAGHRTAPSPSAAAGTAAGGMGASTLPTKLGRATVASSKPAAERHRLRPTSNPRTPSAPAAATLGSTAARASSATLRGSSRTSGSGGRHSSSHPLGAAAAAVAGTAGRASTLHGPAGNQNGWEGEAAAQVAWALETDPDYTAAAAGELAASEASDSGASDTVLNSGQLSEEEAAGIASAPASRAASAVSWRAPSPSAAVTSALQRAGLAAGLHASVLQQQQQQQQPHQEVLWLHPEASGASDVGDGGALSPHGHPAAGQQQQQQAPSVTEEQLPPTRLSMTATAAQHAARISHAASSSVGAPPADVVQFSSGAPGGEGGLPLNLRAPRSTSVVVLSSTGALVGSSAQGLAAAEGWQQQQQEEEQDQQELSFRQSVVRPSGIRTVSASQHMLAGSGRSHSTAPAAAFAAAARDVENGGGSLRRSRSLSLSPSPEHHLGVGRHQGGSPRHTPAAAAAAEGRHSRGPEGLVVTPQQEQQRLSAISHIQQLAQQQQQLELQLQLQLEQQQRLQATSPGAAHSSSKRPTSAVSRSYSAALAGGGTSLASTLPAPRSQPWPSSPMQRSLSAAPGVLPGVSFSLTAHSPGPSSPFELHSQRPSTPPVGHLQPSPSGALAGSRSASPNQVYVPPRAPSPSSAYMAPRPSSPSAMLQGTHSSRPFSPSGVPVQWPTAWQQQSLGARPSSPGSPGGLAGSRPGSPWGVFESRPGSPWGFCSTNQPASPPPRISYMQDWELEQYQRFLKASAEQGMWQHHRNVYQAATDVQDRAIAAWRLTVSFWEVHLARRCLRRWRRRAARASANASTSQRRWLLLCCFRWWLSMARHYRVSRAAAMLQTVSADVLREIQQQLLLPGEGAGPSRGGSPTPWHHPGSQMVVAGQHFGVNVSLQQQLQDLELQIAAATRAKVTWRDRLAAAFYTWREVAGVRGVNSQQERELRKHHEKQLRLQVWEQWQAAFEARSRHLLLLRALYKRRRLRTTALVLAVWRRWAPAKRASRRAGRDARITIVRSSRRRLFRAWHAYAAVRMVKRRKQQLADQQYSARLLQQCLAAWRSLPPLTAQLRDQAEQRAAIVLAKSASRMLAWWQEWTRRRLRKQRMMGVVVNHMQQGLEKRCIQAWKAALKRRKQLDRQALVVGRVVAANKTAACFQSWLFWVQTRQRHRRLLATGLQRTKAMRKLSVLARWRWWVVERQREVEVCEQIMRFDLQQMWRATWQRWTAAHAARLRLYAARDELLGGMLRRVVRNWKAWVDKKADWRVFSEKVMTKVIIRRARVIVQRWHAISARNAHLRALLGAYTDAARLHRLQLCMYLWRQRLEQTAAKRLKALAALTQWEQGLAGKAWRSWRAYYVKRKHKQLQELRAASYAAVRLMDTALMSWVSFWAESRDFAQKAEFFRAGREVQLQLQVLREWRDAAGLEAQDRAVLDRAVAHRSYHLLLVAFFNWRNVTYQKQMQQQKVHGAVAYWAAGSLARAFNTWREWAVRRAEQRDMAGQFLDVLMGRNMAWAFAMLRANAHRKKATALARIHHEQTTLVKALRAWKQRAAAARGFRRFILSTGERLQRDLLREAFKSWRVTAARQARLRDTSTRALEKLQGTSKRAVLLAWLTWTLQQQHKRAAVARALGHWQRSHLAGAFNTWREWARLAQVARHVTGQLRGRTLAQVFAAWHTWAASSSWRRQVEDHLSGKHQFMLLRVCWDQWRSYVQQSMRKRLQLLQAASYLQNVLLGKAFRKWRHVVHELRHKQTRLQYVLSHWQQRHLAAALYGWREYVAARKQKREVLEAVVLHWQAGALSKAFAVWREATQQQHQERDTLGRVVGHWQGNVLLRAFRGWQEGVELRQAKRALVQQVVARWQAGHLRRAFEAWRDSCARLQQQKEQLQTVVQYWTAGTLIKAFRGWKAAAEARKGRRALLERVVARWQQGVKAGAFAAWRQHAHLRHSRKNLLQVAGSKMANTTLLRAFNGWREAAAQRAELRKLLGVAVNRWTQGSLAKAFSTWQDWARLKRLKRRVVARWQQDLLQRSFNTWRDNLQQQQQDSAAQALALAKCANSALWKAFNTWKDSWQQQHRLRAAASAVITRWQQQMLSRAFHGLREHAVYRRMLKGVVMQWQHNTVSKAFDQWLGYTRYQQQLQQAHDRLASRARRRLVAAAWAAWKEASWEGPQERAAAQFHRRKLLSAGIKAWRAVAAEAQQRQQRYAIAAARWRNMGLCKAWSTWRAWAADQQYKRQALSVAAGQWRNVRLGHAFRTWRQRTQERRHYKTLTHAVASRWANTTLAAAFSTWRDFAQRQQRCRTAAAAVAARWHNLRLAAAFNTWRDTTIAARQRVGLANNAANRLRNATLSAAFNGWRHNVARRKQLATAAETVVRQWRHSRLSTAFRSWRDTAARLAQYRQVAGHVGARWRNLRLAACFSTWRTATRRGLAKAAAWEAAGVHWRRRKLSRALQGWRKQMRVQNKMMQAFVSLSGNKSRQMMRKALTTWQLHHAWCQKKAAAAEFAAQKRLRWCWSAWRGVMEERHSKEARAGQLFVGALKRMQHSLLYTAFVQWRRMAQLRKAAETLWLSSNQRSQQQVLRAWRAAAHKQASAKRLLRRMLLNTLAGAFVEWRALAQEGAHWRMVEEQLSEVLTLEHPRVRQNCLAALQRWSHWPLSAAFSSWQEGVVLQQQERDARVRALKFKYYNTALKVFTGLRLAVVSGRLRAAAASRGRRSILRRHMRAWQDGVWQQQSKVGKMSKAVTTWSKLLQRRAFDTWRWWTTYNRAKRRMVGRALKHNRRTQLKEVVQAWRGVVAYHKPLRAAVALMQGKLERRSLQKVWNAWRAHVRRNQLLRQVLLRLQNRTKAAALRAWQARAAFKLQLQAKYLATTQKLRMLVALRAFNRWREYVQQRLHLKARGLAVVLRLQHLRSAAAWKRWQDYVAWKAHRRAQLAGALAHWHNRKAGAVLKGLRHNVQVAHHNQQLAADCLRRVNARTQKRCIAGWHQVAPVLHHRRTVVAYFRARHLRQEGAEAFAWWRGWAAERGRCRRATMRYWNRLLIKAVGGWLMQAEATLLQRGAAAEVHLKRLKVLRAWRVGVAARCRKRELTQACTALRERTLLGRCMRQWVEVTYLAHMSHVALHFRVRRLGCLAVQQWHQVASERAHLRQLSLQLTHQLACRHATQLFTTWRQAAVAQQHRRRVVLRGLFVHWMLWAMDHRRRNAAWRAARAVLNTNCRLRVFYTWRWFTQVRVAKAAAFRSKAAALREALALGDQVARRRKRALLAAAFTAWHLQVAKYARVARKLAGLLETSRRSCFRAWRDITQDGRALRLKAERLGRHSNARRCIHTWAAAAAEQAEAGERAHERAERHWRRHQKRRVVLAWMDQTALGWQRKQALWRVMVLVAWAEDMALLREALAEWRAAAASRAELRTQLVSFVHKRRLGCLGDYFTTWHQFTVAMRPDGDLRLRPGSPLLSPRSPSQDRRLMRRLAAMAGAFEVEAGSQDDAEVFDDLPPTAAIAAAMDRSEAQQPLLQLTRGYRQRRATLSDRPWEEGEGGSPGAAWRGAEGLVGQAGAGDWQPNWDLHSVAESMRQVHKEGVLPWELASVRTLPAPDPTDPTSLTLTQLRHYQRHYQYTVRPGSPAGASAMAVEAGGGGSSSRQGRSARPGRSGAVAFSIRGPEEPGRQGQGQEGYYHDAQGELRRVKGWYDGSPRAGSPQQRRWHAATAADVHWQQRRPRSAGPTYGRRDGEEDEDMEVELGSIADSYDHEPFGPHSAAAGVGQARRRGGGNYRHYGSTGDLYRDEPLLVLGSTRQGVQRAAAEEEEEEWGVSEAGATGAASTSSSRWAGRLPVQPPLRAKTRWRNSGAWAASSSSSPPGAGSSSAARRPGGASVLREGRHHQQQEAEQRPVLFSVGVWQYLGAK